MLRERVRGDLQRDRAHTGGAAPRGGPSGGGGARGRGGEEPPRPPAPPPAARIRARSRWRSGASGVVWASGPGSPSIRKPVVPITTGVQPAVRNTASSRYVEVVLPFVPVIPTTVIAVPGRSNSSAAMGPIA